MDVNGDVLNENNETFTVNLSSPTNGVIADGTGTGTILNDDPEPQIRIRQDRTKVEGDAGTSNFNFPVRLATAGDPTPSGKTVTVDYQVDDGTVGSDQDATTADSDYVDQSGTLTFVDPGGGPITFAVSIDENDGTDPDSALGDIGNAQPVQFTLVAQSPGPDSTCTAPPRRPPRWWAGRPARWRSSAPSRVRSRRTCANFRSRSSANSGSSLV